MQIKSINIAAAQTITFNDKAVQTGIFKTPINGDIFVSTLGFEGDTIVDKSVHGGLDQAVYLYHQEDYDWWSEQLNREIPIGMFGENLTVEGDANIDWTIGDRLTINDVELEITAPRAPCFKLGVKMGDATFVKQFVKACRPGAYARVIKEGRLCAGDSIAISKTEKDFAAVKEVFNLWHSKTKPVEQLKKALASPIASVHKASIQQWYNEQVV